MPATPKSVVGMLNTILVLQIYTIPSLVLVFVFVVGVSLPCGLLYFLIYKISEDAVCCKHLDILLILNPGCDIDLGDLVYEPPRAGPTLWEIGIPDRTAAEFYVPDPNPNYVNRLYINHPDRSNSHPFFFLICLPSVYV